MGLYKNLDLPKDETAIDQWLLDNKDRILVELKEHYEACIEMCGLDDDVNTIPAKELYESASKDILSCSDDIQYYFKEVERWEKLIEDQFAKNDAMAAAKARFKVIK